MTAGSLFFVGLAFSSVEGACTITGSNPTDARTNCATHNDPINGFDPSNLLGRTIANTTDPGSPNIAIYTKTTQRGFVCDADNGLVTPNCAIPTSITGGDPPANIMLFKDRDPGAITNNMFGKIIDFDPSSPGVQSDPGTQMFTPCREGQVVPFLDCSVALTTIDIPAGATNEQINGRVLAPNHIGTFVNPTADATVVGMAITSKGAQISGQWSRDFDNNFEYVPIGKKATNFPNGFVCLNATATQGRLCATWSIIEQDPETGGQELRRLDPVLTNDSTCNNNGGKVVGGPNPGNTVLYVAMCDATAIPNLQAQLNWTALHDDSGNSGSFQSAALYVQMAQGDFTFTINDPTGIDFIPAPAQNPPFPYAGPNGETRYPCSQTGSGSLIAC